MKTIQFRVAMPRPRYFPTMAQAVAIANEYFRRTGRIVAVESVRR